MMSPVPSMAISGLTLTLAINTPFIAPIAAASASTRRRGKLVGELRAIILCNSLGTLTNPASARGILWGYSVLTQFVRGACTAEICKPPVLGRRCVFTIAMTKELEESCTYRAIHDRSTMRVVLAYEFGRYHVEKPLTFAFDDLVRKRLADVFVIDDEGEHVMLKVKYGEPTYMIVIEEGLMKVDPSKVSAGIVGDCKEETLARDAAPLSAGGFELRFGRSGSVKR